MQTFFSLWSRWWRCGLFAFAPLTAHAMSVEPPDFLGLVAAASQVVQGRVVGVKSQKQQSADGPVIRTVIEIEVDQTLKGDTRQVVEFSQLGGEVGPERLEVPGMPQFRIGDEGFFFLHGKKTAASGLVRVGHGCYPVLKDSATGRRYVARGNRAPLTDPSEVSLPLVALPPAAAKSAIPQALSPEAFSKHIASEVARVAAQKNIR